MKEELLQNGLFVFYDYSKSNNANRQSILNGIANHRHIIFTASDLNQYGTWSANNHHILSLCHYHTILPKVSEELKFGYDIDDFNLVEHYVHYNGKVYDASYLYPKNDIDVELVLDQNTYRGNFSLLVGFTSPVSPKCTITDYHKMFIAGHYCCKVINHSCDNDRTLVVSCDSQTIPEAAVLCYYFHKVIFLDNRTGRSFKYLYENETVTDYYIPLCDSNGFNKFINDNLR